MASESNPLVKRIEGMFAARQPLESLWQTVYQFVLPERAQFFLGSSGPGVSPRIGDEVFDSTAIDSAERLVELLITGLIPPWQKWFRIVPGPYIRDPALREQLLPLLELAETVLLSFLNDSNFYLEMQTMLLDRVVGGTGCIQRRPSEDRLRYKTIPLAETALQEDSDGEITAVARRYRLSYRDLERTYPGKLPTTWALAAAEDPDNPKHEVYELDSRTAAGDWATVVMLKEGGHELFRSVYSHQRTFATRWSAMAGSPYGRGPGMRAISDVRALNKLKEMVLKNAALAVAGVYTVTDDGVINPYTVSLEPGARIPVASNNPNDPSILPLPTSGNFDVGSFSMEDLRNSIKRIFMDDQFAPLGRTPQSATEVAERTRVLAQSMGAATARLQHEVLLPLLQDAFAWLASRGELPEGLDLASHDVRVEFVSPLARAQWAEEEQSILEMMNYAAEFGQVDPKAGLAVDVHEALRVLGEKKAVPTSIMRSASEIEQLTEEAAEVVTDMEAEGMDPEVLTL